MAQGDLFQRNWKTLRQQGNETWLCVVSVGELRSIALANAWGDKKRNALEKVIRQFIIADLHSEEVLDGYAGIEAYSQCRLPRIVPQPLSPRNMGKNDIWIASVAFVLGAVLLTTDEDFDHLKEVFLSLERIEVPAWRNWLVNWF